MFDNEELLNEFCRIQDREYGCKDAFGCLSPETVCPLKLAVTVSEKNPKDKDDLIAKTEALLRSRLDEHARDRILADHYKNPHRVYPRAKILCELEEYLLYHIIPDKSCIYWSEGEIKKIEIWEE